MLTDTQRRAVRQFYRRARGRFGLTQSEVAARVPMHRTTLSKVEAGRVELMPEQRARLAQVLQVKAALLPRIKRAA